MELKEFIALSIVDICRGIDAAKTQLNVDESIHTVLPPMGPAFVKQLDVKLNTFDGNYYQEIEFDIAVSAESKSDVNGKAGVSVFSVGANIGSNLSSTDIKTSRLKFKIPIGLSCKNGRESEGKNK